MPGWARASGATSVGGGGRAEGESRGVVRSDSSSFHGPLKVSQVLVLQLPALAVPVSSTTATSTPPLLVPRPSPPDARLVPPQRRYSPDYSQNNAEDDGGGRWKYQARK